MSSKQEILCRLSLVFLWLFTGLTSLWWGKDIGYEILAGAHITGTFADFALHSGAILDLAIGVWLFLGKNLRLCYALQMAVILMYTLLLAVIAPEYWLHPFGPITKNIPILSLIYVLMAAHRKSSHRR